MWTRSINQIENSDIAKWAVVMLAMAILTLNTIVVFNDVKHLIKTQERILQEISDLKTALIAKK